MFYSEQIGVVHSDSFEQLNLEQSYDGLLSMLKSGPFWVDVCDPSIAEMNTFSKVCSRLSSIDDNDQLFGIHPLTTEDIQTQDTREKCEVFPNYYFICIKTFEQNQYSPYYLQPIHFYLVVFKDCILTVGFKSTMFFLTILVSFDARAKHSQCSKANSTSAIIRSSNHIRLDQLRNH